jgi:hypothetical protein
VIAAVGEYAPKREDDVTLVVARYSGT